MAALLAPDCVEVRLRFAEPLHRRGDVALRRRFARVMPQVAERIGFLPRQPYTRFLQLVSVADLVLDTMHFNGMNTSINAFAAGTPVVTLPTSLQRGRFTQAMYRAMGIEDCVAAGADEYADLAVSRRTPNGGVRCVS